MSTTRTCVRKVLDSNQRTEESAYGLASRCLRPLGQLSRMPHQGRVNDHQDYPEGLDVSVSLQAPFLGYLRHSIHLRGDPKAPLAG